MTTLSAPKGVTRIACVKAYATKLHISPIITVKKKKNLKSLDKFLLASKVNYL